MATAKNAKKTKDKDGAHGTEGSFGDVVEHVTTVARSVARAAKVVVGAARDAIEHGVSDATSARAKGKKVRAKAGPIARRVSVAAGKAKKAGRASKKRLKKVAKTARAGLKKAAAAAKSVTKNATGKRGAKKKTKRG